MKKILSIFAMLTLLACKAKAADITLFYMTTCPHCHTAIKFLDSNMKGTSVEKVDVSKNSNRFFKQLKACNIKERGVPLMVIKGNCLQGFDEKETPKKIKKILASKAKDQTEKPVASGSFIKK